MQRLGLSLIAVLMVTACTSTGGISDRYAFWRDNSPKTEGPKPNLADVPVPPNTQDAQNEMDALRQRLETDRNNAYAAAAGYPASDITPISDEAAAPYNDMSSASQEMAPVTSVPTAPYYAAPVASVPAALQTNGTVQYNYAPTDQVYVYGNSNVQYGNPAQYAGQAPAASGGVYRQQAAQLVAGNSSVSINFDALDSGSTATPTGLSPVGLTGQPLVYFNHGSYRLGSGDKRRIKELAEQIKAGAQSVVVVGHASQRTGSSNAVTSKAVNLSMSAKRANVVMQELARHGVNPQQMNVSADGATNAGGKATEKQDRRVDILFD